MSMNATSKARLASVSETAPGVMPASPEWRVKRFLSSDLRPRKTTDTPNEIRADRNVTDIVDVGLAVSGAIDTSLSYSTYDDWLEWALCGTWALNVLTNGATLRTKAVEFTFTNDDGDTLFVRMGGMRVDALEIAIEAQKPVSAKWTLDGVNPSEDVAALAGASYIAATTTPIFNGSLDVSDVAITGIAASPHIQKITLRIQNNLSAVYVLGQKTPLGHVAGRCDVTGTLQCLFEDAAAYAAILAHDTVGLTFTLSDSAGNSYAVEIPQAKLLDGGPGIAGNGQAVTVDIPFQGQFDADLQATIQITRDATIGTAMDFSLADGTSSGLLALITEDF